MKNELKAIKPFLEKFISSSEYVVATTHHYYE
jgi:hypothetical protein